MLWLMLYLLLFQRSHCRHGFMETGIPIPSSDSPSLNFLIEFGTSYHPFKENGNIIIYINRTNYKLEEYFERDIMEKLALPTVIANGEYFGRTLKAVGIKTRIFVVFDNVDELFRNAVDNNLGESHISSTILIYKTNWSKSLTANGIREVFEWCWSRYMINVVLIQQIETIMPIFNGSIVNTVTNQVYQYTPFPQLKVKNVTDRDIYEQTNFYRRLIKNVNGYTFTTPIYNAPPYIFWIPDPSCAGAENCSNILAGSGGRFYTEFIKSINGTMGFTFRKVSFYAAHNETLECVRNRSVHIGGLITSDIYHSGALDIGSTPLWQVNACVMVPLNPEIFYGKYLSRSFQPTVWLMLLILLVMLILLQTFNNFCANCNEIFNGNGCELLYAFGRLFSQPILQAALRTHGLLYKFWQMLILLMCFILLNTYTGTLTSLLSTTVLDEQIETIEDLINSKITLVIDENQKQTLFDNGRVPDELFEVTETLDWTTLFKRRGQMNSSNAFVITSDYWNYLSTTQRRLWKPAYRLCWEQLCTSKFFVKFLIRPDSPFLNALKNFAMTAHQAGLIDKWISTSTAQGLEVNQFKKMEDKTERWKPLRLEYYTYVIWLCIGMWTVACTVFCGEILVHRWGYTLDDD